MTEDSPNDDRTTDTKNLAYPCGGVRPIPIERIDPQALSLLRRSAGEQPWVNGAGLFDSATPTVFVCVRDEVYARKLARKARLMTAWNWNMDFGRVLSFTLYGPTGSQLAAPTFLPFDSKWIDHLLTKGILHVVLGTERVFVQAYEVDFIRGPAGNMSRTGLEDIAGFPDEARLHLWPAAVFGLLKYRTDNGVHNDLLAPADRIQISWMNLIRYLLREINRLANDADYQVRQVFLEGEAKHFAPIAYDILRLFVDGRSTPTKLADDTLEAIRSNWIAAQAAQAPAAMLLTDMNYLYGKMALVGPETELLRHWLLLSALTSPESNNGRHFVWFDTTQSESGLSHLRSLPLDLQWIGERATDYHARIDESQRINCGFFLNDRDIPITPPELHPEQLALSKDFDESAAHEMLNNLLAETAACRKWSIPWGATVELRAGIFDFVQIYEVDREFFLKLTNARGEYALACVDPQKQTWNTPYQKWDDGASADLALRILIAAVLRDFVVVEDREAVFSTRQAPTIRRQARQGPQIIYLPRIRYTSAPNLPRAESQLELRRRAPHLVSPHLRRAAECTDAQRRLAAAYGFTVPTGFTFVRKHTRGKQEGGQSAAPATYRSRSALNAMYEAVEGNLGAVVEWFKFEKDVLRLMKRLGFKVEHVGAHRHDDRGVDVYALSEDEKEGWAIQCKCWRPDRHVGPDVIRELVGAVAAYPAGTKGMLVTTSSFTARADELSRECSIMLIDGTSFSELIGPSTVVPH